MLKRVVMTPVFALKTVPVEEPFFASGAGTILDLKRGFCTVFSFAISNFIRN